MIELIPALFFAAICGALMLGYPVALTLTGVSLGFAGLGMALGVFDGIYLTLIPVSYTHLTLPTSDLV